MFTVITHVPPIQTRPMKGCDIHHRALAAVTHVHNSKGKFHRILRPFAILIAVGKLIYPQQ